MLSYVPVLLPLAAFAPLASAHIGEHSPSQRPGPLLIRLPFSAFWHKAMYGFNVSAQTFSYDNRPVTPLQNMPFDQWWFVSACSTRSHCQQC